MQLLKDQGKEETEKNLQKRFMTPEYEDIDPTPKDKDEDEEKSAGTDHRVQLVKSKEHELKV